MSPELLLAWQSCQRFNVFARNQLGVLSYRPYEFHRWIRFGELGQILSWRDLVLGIESVDKLTGEHRSIDTFKLRARFQCLLEQAVFHNFESRATIFSRPP